jgi:site-specific recombinase
MKSSRIMKSSGISEARMKSSAMFSTWMKSSQISSAWMRSSQISSACDPLSRLQQEANTLTEHRMNSSKTKCRGTHLFALASQPATAVAQVRQLQ